MDVRNGVGVVVLGTLAKVDGDDDYAHRSEGFVHERVFISTDILTHPVSAMNIQDGRERTCPLRLVDGGLEGLPVDLQVVDISRSDGKWLAGQTKCWRRSYRRERHGWR